MSESLAKKIVIFYRLEGFYRVGQDGKKTAPETTGAIF